jgi:formamidopyrimidine-DNA glycosylase
LGERAGRRRRRGLQQAALIAAAAWSSSALLGFVSSTLRDYVGPDGAYGSMQDEFRAYGRAGEPCDRCGAELERIVVAGRGTTFCPLCQALSG